MNPLFAAALELQRFFEARRWRFCSAEDLIVFKAFAGRDRDWLDIDTVILRQRTALAVDTVWRELIPLLELKGDADTQPRLERRLAKAGRG